MALSDEELRKLDAEYRPFAGFSEWAAIELPWDVWDRYVDRLAAFRTQLSHQHRDEMLRRSLRAAALNTGAIEGLHGADRGLTVTVVEHVADWQAAVRRAEGPGAVALVEAALEGFDMAFDVATTLRPVTEVWIRQVHEVVCKPQRTYEVRTAAGVQRQTLPLGEYKKSPNHVELPDGTRHAYAPVDRTADDMHRLVSELGNELFTHAHPVLQAAFAHHALTAVHPFPDGNGRVARALASVYLLRPASIPFFVFDDQKVEYFDALEAADRGDLGSIARFVLERALDTIGLAESWSRASLPGELADEVARARVEQQQTRDAAERLREYLRSAVDEAIEGLALGEAVPLSVATADVTVGTYWYNHSVLPGPAVQVAIGDGSEWPWQHDTFAVALGERGSPFPLGVARANGADVLDVRLADVYPVLKDSLRTRLDAWLRASLSDAVRRMVGPRRAT